MVLTDLLLIRNTPLNTTPTSDLKSSQYLFGFSNLVEFLPYYFTPVLPAFEQEINTNILDVLFYILYNVQRHLPD